MRRFMKLLAAALIVTFAQAAHAQAPNWVVSDVAGKVVIHDATGDHSAKRGMAVPVGGTVATGASSRAILVHGKDFATLSANSRVRVPNAQQTQGGRFALLQEWGNVVFQIEKLPQPHFGVRTPYLAAVVKGTTFSITVTSEGASLQVLEGAVQTSTLDNGAAEIIRPGIVATVTASDRYRLTVQGQDSHAVDSPARSQPPVEGAPRPEQAVPNTDDTASNSPSSEVIAEVIAASPTDLGKATDGLVGGTTQVASADVALVRANRGSSDNAKGDDSNTGKTGSNNSNAGTSNSGNGNDNSGTGNSANGNGNSGTGNSGNGNGNSGTGNSGNGNGNSGTGNSGNGNGNSGTGNSGNGNGNGNSGSGNSGNGNGNSGSGNSGNGNGNSGTGNSGNGNGNSDTGNSGNGNGNSDTGNSGNGNGNSGTGNSGNGNGNSGTGNSGTGNGNSGTGNSGNGNGNSGTGNSGNGNSGNGNSGTGNGSGNGNGNGSNASDPGTGNSGNGNSGNGNGNSGNGNSDGNGKDKVKP